MASQIVIEGVQAGPPYTNGDEPAAINVVARSTSDCQQVRIIVRAVGPQSPIIGARVVATADDPTAPVPLTALATTLFTLPAVGLRCGDSLFVEVRSLQNSACVATGHHVIQCKPAPTTVHPGAGDGNGSTGRPSWSPSRCLFTAAAAAMMLLAALSLIAYGIALQSAISISAGLVLVAAAGVAWALWEFWCSPTICVRLGVLCWVFKRGFIMAIPAFPLSSSALIILVLIAYGSAAGIFVHWLRNRQCPVPSARLPLTQLPI